MKKLVSVLLSLFITLSIPAWAKDPLPSWNDGPNKNAIITFVEKTTQAQSPDFVPQPERIAVFDNDGTLWSEQPTYVDYQFTLDRIKYLAPGKPEWKTQQPFKAVLENDQTALKASGEEGLMQLTLATQAGMSTEEFQNIVSQWLKTERHPIYKRPYTELTYKPMQEVLDFLKENGYKNYIVSGAGAEFLRVWTEKVYGIPPEQVIGTSIKTKFEILDGRPKLIGMPEVQFINNGGEKAVSIHQVIGRRPIVAFGNSDGDLQMLQWVTSGSGARLGLLVHHTDAERETAYDRYSSVGRLDKALDAAPTNKWIVVDMKSDWAQIFPDQP